jgi:iron complex outermembrane receptor protein
MKKNLTISAIFILILFFEKKTTAQVQTDSLKSEFNAFQLGEITVLAQKEKESVSSTEMQKMNKTDVASSLNLLPSVIFSNIGGRNEGTIYMRGFDVRSIPVYCDGIPVYVPYDGYVDLSRFTNADLSEIEVSKGFSSILFGPNTIGGAINLISTKPIHKIEIHAKVGVMSGNAYNTSANVGSNLGKFYIQGNFSKLKRKFVPLSADFDTSKLQSDFKLNNSYTNDSKVSLKAGFTPNKTDEYSVNYIYQHGEKGTPIYLGSDPSIKIRYWQWPYWDKESVYFISKTMFAQKNYVKTRIFYDKFKNRLNSYNDNTYTTQTAKYAFSSFYNDYSVGANVEAGTQILSNNNLKFAAHLKNDDHSENNAGEPVRHVSDNTYSVGIEDEFTPFATLKLIPGISYNLRKSLKAEEYNSTTQVISDFPNNQNSATNAQIAAEYKMSSNINFRLTTSMKSRFATMKDRYSFKMGTAISNPDLKAETAVNYEFASNISVFNQIKFQPALFYSKLQNTIQQVDNVQPGISQMQNTGDAEFLGADFSISYKPLEILNFSANYSYIEQHNLSKPDIKFTDVPNNKIFGIIDFQPKKRIDFVVSAEYNTKRYSTSYGNESPEFMLFNSQISFGFVKYLTIEAGVNNIFDKNYSLEEGYPAPGRNYYVSLSFDFNK